MNGRLLEICFRGQAIERGRLPLAHLSSFLGSWRKVLQRTGRVLRGETRSVRPGQPPQDLKSELEFEFVSFSGEGGTAILELDRRQENASFPEMDFGLKVLQSAIGGLKDLESENPGKELPNGMDAGVLRAWRDAGVLFGQDIDAIRFSLIGLDGPALAVLTPSLLERIRERLATAQIDIRKIQGRLLMVDFTGDETRCQFHPDDGEPILCRVDEERKDAVLANMLQDVVITGEVQNDSATGKIAAITIKDIERLSDPAAPEPERTSDPSQLWDPPDTDA